MTTPQTPPPQQPPNVPPQPPYPGYYPPPPRQTNVFGAFALAVALFALLGSCAVSVTGSAADASSGVVFVAVVAVGLGVLGVVRKGNFGKGTAIWGICLGALALMSGLGSTSTPTASSSASSLTSSGSHSSYRTPAVAQPAASLPAGTFTDGMYEVGTGAGQMPPGRYYTDGQSTLGSCHWSRQTTTDSTPDSIIENSLRKGPQFLTVKPTDGYVVLGWGCTWAPK